ncbi:NAD-dependent epimerase/dehydratase family protein [Actinomadura xylanilytica]|uniref:NAD-dependent epimerase/dehydratase family protein n=1 Tax=Actinomadura xylanilytica TaxID=887459 RepID=UPI00255B372B|nr:NAD-dependent epimerase/dehydratase family protein [Actinomadura xylanilytica]MDL4777360.1 NAD-dependent epimerase/dehydratase family protein [Actinomadura xylanilytica]
MTGGTGFVGAHSVAAIVGSGHQVRLVVRDEARVEPALAPLGVPLDAVDTTGADVTDERAMRRALKGTDAVLHAAAVYSFDRRRHAAMARTNARGTEVTLEAAGRAGADPIVHVSTVGALYPSPHGPVHAGSPVGRPRERYMASKAAAEAVARGLQERGAPVVITYPPPLLGPDDPHLGDQNARLRDLLRGLMPMWPGGGFPLGDVRDTARLHAEVLRRAEPGRNRLFGPGRHVSTRRYVQTVREATGRALPALFLPARAMLPAARLTDQVQRVWPWHIPAEYGAAYACAVSAPVDEGADRLGIDGRPLAETVRDAVRWLHRQGHLSGRQAGRAARSAGASAKRL